MSRVVMLSLHFEHRKTTDRRRWVEPNRSIEHDSKSTRTNSVHAVPAAIDVLGNAIHAARAVMSKSHCQSRHQGAQRTLAPVKERQGHELPRSRGFRLYSSSTNFSTK